jgi:hypothetical protein
VVDLDKKTVTVNLKSKITDDEIKKRVNDAGYNAKKNYMDRLINRIITFFSLFGSLSTLLCCALPVTLVSLGMGASFASLTASFPQLIWLTERKEALFVITAILLIISFVMIKKAEKMPCPIELSQRELCERSKRVSKRIYWGTVVIYLTGLSFSYVLPFILT